MLVDIGHEWRLVNSVSKYDDIMDMEKTMLRNVAVARMPLHVHVLEDRLHFVRQYVEERIEAKMEERKDVSREPYRYEFECTLCGGFRSEFSPELPSPLLELRLSHVNGEDQVLNCPGLIVAQVHDL